MNVLVIAFHNLCFTLTVKKVRDFYSYERVESTEFTEELSQEASCSSQVPDGEISSDGLFHPPSTPAFGFPKTQMVSRERPCQSSWFQEFLWLHTIQGTINFYSLCHGGVEDLQSIFSFGSNKYEILSPYVKKVK